MQSIQLESLIRIKHWIKKGLFMGVVGIALVAPDLIWEHIAHLLHVCYESLAFLLEEILIHGMGFTKHHAQMLVFYLFMFVLCGLLWFLWRRLPFLLEACKAYILLFLLGVRDYVMGTWLALTGSQKIQLLIANLIGLGLGISLLLL